MTVRPIIFSAPMVRALLEGRKTQTRRLAWRSGTSFVGDGPARPGHKVEYTNIGSTPVPLSRAPSPWQRVKPGDLLWVRESFAEEHPLAVQPGRYSRDGQAGIPGPPGVSYRAIYRADGEPLQVWRRRDGEHPYFTLSGPADEIGARYPCVESNFDRDGKSIYWTPSIHMPRWASRLTLEVRAVRIEPLQAIGLVDAIAEGCEIRQFWLFGAGTDERNAIGRNVYRRLWESLHGEPSWTSNPEVVALTFVAHKLNIDEHLRQREAA